MLFRSGYQSDLDSFKGLGPLTDQSHISSSKVTLQNNIDTIIRQFDGYEYFLYYTSGSKSWPKSGSTVAPYTNWGVDSVSASVW